MILRNAIARAHARGIIGQRGKIAPRERTCCGDDVARKADRGRLPACEKMRAHGIGDVQPAIEQLVAFASSS
jgi:hypothetical protein